MRSLTILNLLPKKLSSDVIIKRFYPGHVHKVLNLIHKKVPQSLTPLPQQLNLTLDNNLQIQKVMAYLTFLSYCKNNFPLTAKSLHNSLYIYKNLDKEHIFCTTTNPTIISSNFKKVNINGDKIITENMHNYTFEFKFLFNNTIPGTPLQKLYILERTAKNIKVSRGWVHNQILDESFLKNDDLFTKALNLIIVENSSGNTDLNFVNEIKIAVNHCKFLITQNINIKEYRLLHKNSPESDEALDSKAATGQPDCDVLMITYNPIINIYSKIYFDIKQKEFESLDQQYRFIKIIYKENFYEESLQKFKALQELYVKNTKITLSKYSTTSIDVEILLNNLNNLTLTEQINKIHCFIIQNHNKAYGKMAILLQEELKISPFHHAKINSIEDADSKQFNSKLFHTENAPLFNTESQRLYNKYLPMAKETTQKIFDEWTKEALFNITE